jgi:uncharacterized membrane protein
VTFASPLPWWAFALVLAGAAAVAWAAYARAPVTPPRRLALSLLRFGLLLLLVLLLCRPVARAGPEDAADALVPILVDVSRSMGIEDADGQRRIDKARALLTEDLLPALSAKLQTEVLAFGSAVRPSTPDSLDAADRRSDLAAALADVRQRYSGRTVAGIVLLSDGGDTSASGKGSPIQVAEAGAAVFTLGIGARTIERDREVSGVTVADSVLEGSRVDLAVSAVSHGHGTAPIELRLLENGRPIDVRRVAPPADGVPVRELFHVNPAAGAPTVYTVEVPAAEGERVPENNSRSVLVSPPSRPRRVLLVQGAPGFEHSFLRRAWAGDPALDVDSVVRKGQNDRGSDTFYIQASGDRSAALASGYPASAEALFAYDALVLANVEGALLTTAQLEATRDFVGRRGGGLLVLGGHSFLRRGLSGTPLEDVLPLDPGQRGRDVVQASDGSPGPNRVALTAEGETHPIMQLAASAGETRKRWEAVPALASIAPLGGARAGAAVLALASGEGGTVRPLVAVQRYGGGRSMVFTGEASWRWRMLLPADDRSFDTFWRQAARWLALAATEPVSIEAPTGSAAGDLLTFRILARTPAFEPAAGATLDVRVTRPDGRIESVPAAADTGEGQEGVYLARVRADDPGIYRLTADVSRNGAPAAVAAASVLAGGVDTEMSDPRLNARLLERVAATTGGRTIAAGDATSLAEELRSKVPLAMQASRRDLWHNGWSLALILGLLAAEWIARRRWGLR